MAGTSKANAFMVATLLMTSEDIKHPLCDEELCERLQGPKGVRPEVEAFVTAIESKGQP